MKATSTVMVTTSSVPSLSSIAVDAVALKTWVAGKLLFDRAADIQERVLPATDEEALRKQFNVSPKPPLTDVVKACPALIKQPAQVLTKARSQRIALIGGTVHDGVGQSISNATVLINEVGVIEAVGKADAVSVPAGYRKVDVTGKHIAPGFFDAISAKTVSFLPAMKTWWPFLIATTNLCWHYLQKAPAKKQKDCVPVFIILQKTLAFQL